MPNYKLKVPFDSSTWSSFDLDQVRTFAQGLEARLRRRNQSDKLHYLWSPSPNIARLLQCRKLDTQCPYCLSQFVERQAKSVPCNSISRFNWEDYLYETVKFCSSASSTRSFSSESVISGGGGTTLAAQIFRKTFPPSILRWRVLTQKKAFGVTKNLELKKNEEQKKDYSRYSK